MRWPFLQTPSFAVLPTWEGLIFRRKDDSATVRTLAFERTSIAPHLSACFSRRPTCASLERPIGERLPENRDQTSCSALPSEWCASWITERIQSDSFGTMRCTASDCKTHSVIRAAGHRIRCPSTKIMHDVCVRDFEF